GAYQQKPQRRRHDERDDEEPTDQDPNAALIRCVYANSGAAAAMIRARPLSAIFIHCQLTMIRSGDLRPVVLHVTLTSRPGAACAPSALQSHVLPSSSTTLRASMCFTPIEEEPATASCLKEDATDRT